MTEHQEQAALFEWAAWNEQRYPDLFLLHAIPNGGHRHKAVAAKLKAEGVKPGVPDICLPVPRGRYHGLYIELKAGRNKPTPDQIAWIVLLRKQGYAAEVRHGWEAARDLILTYLGKRDKRGKTHESKSTEKATN